MQFHLNMNFKQFLCFLLLTKSTQSFINNLFISDLERILFLHCGSSVVLPRVRDIDTHTAKNIHCLAVQQTRARTNAHKQT